MRLVISADHRGVAATRQLAERLRGMGHEVSVLGNLTGETCDYPESAALVGSSIAARKADLGILLCGSGIGMCIAANKVKGVRAALVHDELTAEMARSHNDANVLCMSADLLGQRLIEKIVDVFLATNFQGGRHERRVRKISAIENGQDPASIS